MKQNKSKSNKLFKNNYIKQKELAAAAKTTTKVAEL